MKPSIIPPLEQQLRVALALGSSWTFGAAALAAASEIANPCQQRAPLEAGSIRVSCPEESTEVEQRVRVFAIRSLTTPEASRHPLVNVQTGIGAPVDGEGVSYLELARIGVGRFMSADLLPGKYVVIAVPPSLAGTVCFDHTQSLCDLPRWTNVSCVEVSKGAVAEVALQPPQQHDIHIRFTVGGKPLSAAKVVLIPHATRARIVELARFNCAEEEPGSYVLRGRLGGDYFVFVTSDELSAPYQSTLHVADDAPQTAATIPLAARTVCRFTLDDKTPAPPAFAVAIPMDGGITAADTCESPFAPPIDVWRSTAGSRAAIGWRKGEAPNPGTFVRRDEMSGNPIWLCGVRTFVQSDGTARFVGLSPSTDYLIELHQPGSNVYRSLLPAADVARPDVACIRFEGKGAMRLELPSEFHAALGRRPVNIQIVQCVNGGELGLYFDSTPFAFHRPEIMCPDLEVGRYRITMYANIGVVERGHCEWEIVSEQDVSVKRGETTGVRLMLP